MLILQEMLSSVPVFLVEVFGIVVKTEVHIRIFLLITAVQWNLDLTKVPRDWEIGLLYQGVVISKTLSYMYRGTFKITIKGIDFA